MKLALLITFILLSTFAQAQSLKKRLENLKGNWQGKLTYLDYTTAQPFVMDANLEILQLNLSDTFLFKNSYPKEPQANSVDTIIVAKNGKRLSKNKVIAIKGKDPVHGIEIITQENGLDGNDNKPAIIQHIYKIGLLNFDIIKEVKFKGTTKFIQRSAYNYLKK